MAGRPKRREAQAREMAQDRAHLDQNAWTVDWNLIASRGATKVRVTVEDEPAFVIDVAQLMADNDQDEEVAEAVTRVLNGRTGWVGGGASPAAKIEAVGKSKSRTRHRNPGTSLRGAALYVNPRRR